MRLDVYIHLSPQLERRLRAIDTRLDLITAYQEQIMATMADLNAAVARNTDAEAAALAYLRGIVQQLKDAQAAGDPAALDAAIKAIDANTAAAASAIVENTPAAG